MEEKEEERTTDAEIVTYISPVESIVPETNDPERNEEIRRFFAFTYLLGALRLAGCSVYSFEIHENKETHGRRVRAEFESGAERWADITGDSVPCALYDVMRQIKELQERG